MYKLPYSGPEIEERLAKLDTLNADDFGISEELGDLYGLYGDDANVGKVLESLKRPGLIVVKLSSDFSKTSVTESGYVPWTEVVIDTIEQAVFTEEYNTKFIVPEGIAKVKLFGFIHAFGANLVNVALKVYKNDVILPIMPVYTNWYSTNYNEQWRDIETPLIVDTYPLDVVPGDHFEIYYSKTNINGSASNVFGVRANSYFGLEVLECTA